MDKKKILTDTAVKMVKETGIINLTRLDLCTRAGIADGSFNHIMGTTFADFVEALKKSNPDAGTYKISKSRISPSLRKESILIAAVSASLTSDYNTVTRSDVAEKAGISVGLVTHHFGTMNQLRRAIIRYAVSHEVLDIIAQGLVCKDPQALKASRELRLKALGHLADIADA